LAALWQLSCPSSCLLRTEALGVLSGKAASLGVERLWLYAKAVLTDGRCSMIIQLVQIKMNGMLLEGEALRRCAKSTLAMIDDEASFEGIFDDLQQFEGEEQAGHAEQPDVMTCSAMQKDRWPLRLSCPWLFCFGFVRKAHSCLTRVVWAMLGTLKHLKPQLRRLGIKLHDPPITCKRPVTGGPESKQRANQPVTCFLRPEKIDPSQVGQLTLRS
jgi:hypothetical protein